MNDEETRYFPSFFIGEAAMPCIAPQNLLPPDSTPVPIELDSLFISRPIDAPNPLNRRVPKALLLDSLLSGVDIAASIASLNMSLSTVNS